MAAARRVRLVRKQPDPLASHNQAIADEGWSELVALSADTKRKHIHWTHVKTDDPSHVQPHQLSRRELWEHLERVYKEVYPEPANRTGSILLFGMVVKELHAESTRDELRHEHHHAPTYCTKQHRWNRIAQVSLEKYHIKLHAACHDGYTSMYQYARKPSTKKPLSELDAEPFLSPDHPRGDALRRLLEVGSFSTRGNAARHGRQDAEGGEDIASNPQGNAKRIRVGDVYEIVRAGGFRNALALQAHAETLAHQGSPTLAHFCTSHGATRLQDHLNAAWAIIDAPKALSSRPTLLAKLHECATSRRCDCGGVWKAGAAFVLQNNSEDPLRFGRDICRALALGAKRGVNMALVGEPGSGKSMILQPLESIFQTMPPPEDGSTFPMCGLIDAEIILFQDFEYDPKTVNFQDLLRLLVGERMGVRVPGQKNVFCNNRAPMFYSALEKIAPKDIKCSEQTLQRKTVAMDEHFTIRTWDHRLPPWKRVPDFPHCAACFASFMLGNGAAWHARLDEDEQ